MGVGQTRIRLVTCYALPQSYQEQLLTVRCALNDIQRMPARGIVALRAGYQDAPQRFCPRRCAFIAGFSTSRGDLLRSSCDNCSTYTGKRMACALQAACHTSNRGEDFFHCLRIRTQLLLVKPSAAASSTQYQLERSFKSKPIVNF